MRAQEVARSFRAWFFLVERVDREHATRLEDLPRMGREHPDRSSRSAVSPLRKGRSLAASELGSAGPGAPGSRVLGQGFWILAQLTAGRDRSLCGTCCVRYVC